MPGLLDWIGGIFGSPQYGPPAPPSGGMLTNPQGIREQALYGALGQLGAGLLAAGARRPVSQPSPLPQALAGFGPAYRQGIQTGQQEAAIERQADQERRWNDVVSGTTPIPGLSADRRQMLGLLGSQLGPQALAQIITRPTGRAMNDQEIAAARLTPGLPWQVDQNGLYSLPSHDPNVLQAGSAATTRGRVGVEGYGVQGVGYIPPSAFQPGAGAPTPGGVPRGPVGAAPPNPGALVRPGAPAGDPRRGERPWVAEDWLGMPGMTREDAQARADSMNQIQPGITAQAPGMAGPQPQPQQAGMPRAVPVPGMPGGSIIMPPSPQQGRYEAQSGENAAQYLNTRIVQPATSAVSALQTAQRMRQILGTGEIATGPGSAVRDYIAEVARAYGGETGGRWANSIQGADYATLRGLTARQVLDGLGGSLGTGISNADRDYIASTVPNPFQSTESMQRFITLLEDRALGQVDRSLRAYSRSAPNFNPQTDPFVNDVHIGLQDLGINPADIRGERQRRQQAEAERRAAPPAPVAPPPPAPMPPGGQAIPGPQGTTGRLQMIPPQPAGPQSQPLPDRPTTGQTARNPTTGERIRFDGLRWVPISRDTDMRAR